MLVVKVRTLALDRKGDNVLLFNRYEGNTDLLVMYADTMPLNKCRTPSYNTSPKTFPLEDRFPLSLKNVKKHWSKCLGKISGESLRGKCLGKSLGEVSTYFDHFLRHNVPIY